MHLFERIRLSAGRSIGSTSATTLGNSLIDWNLNQPRQFEALPFRAHVFGEFETFVKKLIFPTDAPCGAFDPVFDI